MNGFLINHFQLEIIMDKNKNYININPYFDDHFLYRF